MKKLNKLLILIALIVLVFGIYTIFRTDKIKYVALGDSVAEGMNPYGEVGYSYTDYLSDSFKHKNMLSSYTKKYTKSGYETSNIISDLNVNNELKKDLRESNLVTISIGANDLIHTIKLTELNVNNILELKPKIKELFPKIDNCLKEIRKYAKQDIIIVGYYNPMPFLFNTSGNDLDTLFAYIDDEYEKIANKYDCTYISLYQLFKNNSNFLPNPADIHPNLEGYKAISDKILEKYLKKS